MFSQTCACTSGTSLHFLTVHTKVLQLLWWNMYFPHPFLSWICIKLIKTDPLQFLYNESRNFHAYLTPLCPDINLFLNLQGGKLRRTSAFHKNLNLSSKDLHFDWWCCDIIGVAISLGHGFLRDHIFMCIGLAYFFSKTNVTNVFHGLTAASTGAVFRDCSKISRALWTHSWL